MIDLLAEQSGALVNILLPAAAVAGVIIITLAVLWQVRSRIARREAGRGTPRQRIEQIKARAETDTELDHRMVELLDTARRITSQLDTKAKHLEILIEEADARIAIMHGGSVIQESDDPAEETEPAALRSHVEASAKDDLDPLTAEVHRLSDEGLSAVEIARELGETTGKIELILALRRTER